MFVQVIQGKVEDPAAVRAQFDRWADELGPTAIGWLGTTAGVTDDGTLVVIARFENAEKAQQNSDRPEQGESWAELSNLFTDEPTFLDGTEVVEDVVGDPDTAGFVQVIRGRTSNPDRAREISSQGSDEWAGFRPDVLGSLLIGSGEDYAMAIWFTSEAEAREGEKKEMPEAMAAQMEEINSLEVGEPTFYDLKDPWLFSPR